MAASLAAVHATDPTTPFLSARGRIPGFTLEDLDRALYEARVLRRMHTIRRTLFLVPLEDVPVFEAGAAREVARKERARLAGWLAESMTGAQVTRWVDRLAAEVLDTLGDSEMSTRELTTALPELATPVALGSGKWAATVPISSRVLFLMAMEGLLVRARPAGSWRSSQYRWADAGSWDGVAPGAITEEEGRLALARRYVETHGPVTLTDLRWWTGWTLTRARDALARLDTVQVELDGEESGFVLEGDADPVEAAGPSVTLLPALDSTPMGWKQRGWFLGAGEDQLFDSNGNVGPTVWVDGRVVGGWAQTQDGTVVYELLEAVAPHEREMIDAQAVALTEWLDGVVVMPRFPSPMSKRLTRAE